MNPEQDKDKVETEELSLLNKENIIFPHQSCDSYENNEKNGNFHIKFNYFHKNQTGFPCFPYFPHYNYGFGSSNDYNSISYYSNFDPSFFRWDRLLFIPILISFREFSFSDEILWDISMTNPCFLREFSLKWLNDKLNQSFLSQNQQLKKEFFRFDSQVLLYNKRQDNQLIQVRKDENSACLSIKSLSHEENESKSL